MDSIKDLLKKKADSLDVDSKLSELELIQTVLTRHFDQQAIVKRLDKGNLFIQVTSSAAASEVRLKQVTLLDELSRVLKSAPKRLVIRQ